MDPELQSTAIGMLAPIHLGSLTDEQLTHALHNVPRLGGTPAWVPDTQILTFSRRSRALDERD